MAYLADKTPAELTAKTTPIDADLVILGDSTDASEVAKKVTWANIKATLKTYLDTLYAPVLGADDNYVTDAEKVVIGNTSGTNSGNETASTIGVIVNSSSAATPNDTDLVATVESSVVKKITWTNVKAFLKTYLDTLYQPLDSITNIDVADLADGTDGELITWDASGNPTTVAVGTSGQVLTSNGAGAAPTFQDAGGTKARVRAYKTTTTGFGASYGQIVFDAESYDVGGDFATGAFTAPRTGYYHIIANAYGTSTSSSSARSMGLAIYKNGSLYSEGGATKVGATSVECGVATSDILSLSVNDVITIYGKAVNNEFTAAAGEDDTYVAISEL